MWWDVGPALVGCLSIISPEDLESKVIDTSCEDRHNFVCKFKIEINQNNGIVTSSFGFRDTRLHSGRFLKHEASQIRICPREKPNAINIDGITMCCKLDKDCADQTPQGDLRKCCDQFPNTKPTVPIIGEIPRIRVAPAT